MAGDLQLPVLEGERAGESGHGQAAVALQQHDLQRWPVETEEVGQPAAEVGIGAGAFQRHAIQQTQGGVGRQPAVARHPAIHTEQRQGQPQAVEADADQMGEGAIRSAAPEQMQVAMFAIAAVTVVVTLGAAGGITQIRRRIVLLLDQGHTAGEGTHQGAVALGQAQPVVQGAAGGAVALDRHGFSGRARSLLHGRRSRRSGSVCPRGPCLVLRGWSAPLCQPGRASCGGPAWSYRRCSGPA